MRIRRARPEDAKEIASMNRKTVRNVNKKDYTKRQIAAWSSMNKARRLCKAIKEGRKIWVAVDKDEIVGMATLLPEEKEVGGFYIKHNKIGTGIGKKLNEKIEQEAKKKNIKELKLCSTITAAPFYKKRGYKKIRKTHVTMNKVKIPCVIMKKKL